MSHYLSDLLPGYLDRLKAFEGLRLKAYIPKGEPDTGVYTIGYGHRTKSVAPGAVITRAQADDLLLSDVSDVVERLRYSVGLAFWRRLTNGQRTALVDFVFNLGIGNFNRSTLKKMILRDVSDVRIQSEFMRWVYAGGRRLPGLYKRRIYNVECWYN